MHCAIDTIRNHQFSMRIDSGRAEGEAAKQAVQEATDRDRSEKGSA